MKIKFNEPYLSGNELAYMEDVFRRRQFYGMGEYTRRCEAHICERLSVPRALLTDSCTSALEIAALLLRNEEKNEVILPSYTFTSTASAFVRAGFVPVFADIDPHTMMLDTEDVSERITARTGAVVLVHYGGLPGDVFELRKLCNRNGLFLVEDAAQAFDCHWNGEALGSIGDIGCFSFHETKNIHAGLSGALVLAEGQLLDRAMWIRERGTNRQEVLRGVVDKYSWVELGGSFYPTELQAAFLCAQLESLDKNIAVRCQIHRTYSEGLAKLRSDGKLHFNDSPPGFITNFHAFFILLSSAEECERVRLALQDNGVMAYIGYVPLHSSKVGLCLGSRIGDLPVTEECASRVLRLPLHNNLSVDDAGFVVDCLVKSLESRSVKFS
jgi:dTDP-4-amino-4,6-dideoxygalactose transaminase